MKKTHCIYVIELNKEILINKAFKKMNPNYDESKPCVYVGMTSKTPEQRFLEHTTGARKKNGDPLFSRKVKKHGIRLKPRLYKSHNPMTEKEAKEFEIEKARRLRKRGYGVWQN
ncbi:hypothetical protein N9M19_04950 [Gammaproteobacteria bacterium]|nr:hypothetical protein [Gammaproteobacteria bacterium]